MVITFKNILLLIINKKLFIAFAFFRMRLDYILSLRQPTFSRWTAHHFIFFLWCLAADYLLLFYQFRFYHTTSHYLCHEICYHFRLVEIALRLSRNLMVYSKRFTFTHRLSYLLKQPYRTMSDYSIFIKTLPSTNT